MRVAKKKTSEISRGERPTLREALQRGFAMPPEAALDAPLITVTGGGLVTVENHKNLLTFAEGQVVVAAKGYNVKIEGAGLEIARITPEGLTLRGKIDNIGIVR